MRGSMKNNWKNKMMQFMQGRYGADQMGQMLSAVSMVFLIISLFSRNQAWFLLAVIGIVYNYFRMFSKNISKRYAENREPRFSDVKWSAESVEEGEEAELTASVQDIADGNMVTLQVFREGKGPEDSVAMAKFPLSVKGGSVSAKWHYRADQSEMPPKSDPRFVFTAHCAWCNFEKSSNALEVKLVRPEIKKAEWQDKDGSSTSKGLVGEPLKLHAETKDMDGGVTFWIYDDKGRLVTSIGADIKGDKADAEWAYHWDGIPLKEKPKFKFEVRGQRCKRVESSECEISQKIKAVLRDEFNEVISKGFKGTLQLVGGSTEEINFDSDGIFEKEDLIPGSYKLRLKVDK